MNQTLHILKKDIRHLWWETVAVLAVMVTFAVVDSRRSLPDNERAPLSLFAAIVMVLGWYYLVARLVLDESLATEIQFWVTRPYTWRRLLVSKALFIIIFINIPLLAAHCAILAASGFAPSSYLSGLLWKQLALTVVFLLPSFAIATIAASLLQFANFTLAFAACWFAWLVSSLYSPHGDWVLQMVVGGLIAAGALTVILRQYARRLTFGSRAILVSVGALVLAAGWLGYLRPAIEAGRIAATSDDASILLAFEPGRRGSQAKSTGSSSGSPASTDGRAPDTAGVQIDLPIEVSGLSGGLDLDADAMNASLAGPAGQTWQLNGDPRQWNSSTRFVRQNERLFIARLQVDRPFFDEVKSALANCHISLELTLFRDVGATPLPRWGATVPVPGLGLCSNRGHFVCTSPMRRPARIAFEPVDRPECMPDRGRGFYPQTAGSMWGDWYSPFPAEFGPSPLISFDLQIGPERINCPNSWLALIPQRPLAHFRRTLEIGDLRLADYAVQ
jgi:hypothetical protein